MSRNPQQIRWWPAVLILALATVALGRTWFLEPEWTGQDRIYRTIGVTLGTTALLAIWLMLFSRLARRTRVLAMVTVLATIAVLAGTVRVRGVTGDVMLIFEWRWARQNDAALESLAATATSAPPPDLVASPAPVTPVAPADKPSTPRVVGSVPPAGASDYPQFLGPDRNGVLPGLRLARDWTAHPPRLVWKRRLGAGWSGFAVAGLAITQEQRGEREMVVAYDLATGAPRWAHGDRARYETTVAGIGPRATPTISGGRVYTVGPTGILNCLDLETGKARWHRNIAEDNDAPNPDWGRSGSPLAIDNLIVVSAGGANGRSLAAYDRDSGAVAWRGGSDSVGFSSPLVATLAGARQILIFNQGSVASHDPATGRILWEYPWPPDQPNVAQPVILTGDRVLVSSGYGVGSKLLQVETGEDGALRARLVWESPRLKAKFTNLVVHEGFVYGLDDGVLVCLDPANGERRWKSGRYGHGQVILAGDVLLVQTEEGEIVLVEPRPDAHKELAKFTAFTQKTWNPPALAGRFLLVRNDAEAACYELPRRQEAGGRR